MGIVAFVATALILIATLFMLRKKPKLTNPLVFFLSLWTLILFLSILKLYDLDQASDLSYILLLIMTTSFTVGYFIYAFLYRKKHLEAKNSTTNKIEQLPSLKSSIIMKIFFAIITVMVVLNVIDLCIGFSYVMSGTPMWQVRNWTLEPFGSVNPILSRRSFIEDAFRSIIASPLTTLLPPLAAYYFFSSKDKLSRNSLLILSIVYLIVSSLAGGGGRIGFIYYAACFIFAYAILKRAKMLRKEFNAKKILLALGLCALPIIILTILRTDATKLFKQFYTYFAIPPVLLSKWLPIISGAGLTFGLTTFFGVHSYGFRALKTVGLSALVPTIFDSAFDNILAAEEYLNLGAGNFNAFVTPVYYFMYDGGILAVILFSLLFGVLCSVVYKKLENRVSGKNFLLYLLVFYGILVSFMRAQTAIPSFIISIIFVFILFWQHKPRNRDKKKNEK